MRHDCVDMTDSMASDGSSMQMSEVESDDGGAAEARVYYGGVGLANLGEFNLAELNLAQLPCPVVSCRPLQIYLSCFHGLRLALARVSLRLVLSCSVCQWCRHHLLLGEWLAVARLSLAWCKRLDWQLDCAVADVCCRVCRYVFGRVK